MDILQRKCNEQFAIHRAKHLELLGGMIGDPLEEPPSQVLIEILMPHQKWAGDLCYSVMRQTACDIIISCGSRVNLDPNDVVAGLERILGGGDVPNKVEHRQCGILRMQLMDRIFYQG